MQRLALVAVLAAVASLAAAGPATSEPKAQPKAPAAGVCVPKSVRLEYFSSLGTKLGEYDAPFSKLVRVYPNDPYNFKCLWNAPNSTAEAFVVFIGIVPPGLPGRIPSGDCGRNRPDSPPFYHSRKRYLGVSGGNRIEFQQAVGGNEKVIKGVLAAAEAAGVGQACPGATKPKPTPPPAPKPKPTPKPASGQLGIDYKMPARFGDEDPDGTIHYPTLKEMAPDEWRVFLDIRRKDGKACDRGDAIAVTANGVVLTPAKLERVSRCRVQATLPREGTYRIVVRMKTTTGVLRGERDIVVQDWLIVGLGDSNGSGEGTPDIASSNPGVVRWKSQRCDRSANAYQAKTALTLEDRDVRTSVTLIHLACSGASVVKGLVGGYEGIVSLRPDLPAQVTNMKKLAQGREIDAVLISIGINDLGFAQLVGHCIKRQGCPSSPFPESTSRTSLAEVMQERLDSLPLRYALLAEALDQQKIPPSRVYLNEYFDSTRDDDLSFCNPLIGTPLGSFTRAEAKWAHDSILVPLNAAVEAAAKKHKWRFISGSQKAFGPHGYCAKAPWIVGLVESLSNQANENGTLHANAKGNEVQAGFNVTTVRADFYKGGRTRAPKP